MLNNKLHSYKNSQYTFNVQWQWLTVLNDYVHNIRVQADENEKKKNNRDLRLKEEKRIIIFSIHSTNEHIYMNNTITYNSLIWNNICKKKDKQIINQRHIRERRFLCFFMQELNEEKANNKNNKNCVYPKNSISFRHFHIRIAPATSKHKCTSIFWMKKKCQKEILYEAAEWKEMNWNVSKSSKRIGRKKK